VDPAIASHGGRIVKTTGDGLLLEFPSVVNAVRCAVVVRQWLTTPQGHRRLTPSVCSHPAAR
jgi:class 3 adenylate cyclase